MTYRPLRNDDPMRDDVDGDEAMVPRVPNLPPEPSARQIAEHELTGHAVCRSWCRHCVASKGRAQAHSSRETRQRRCVANLVCQVSEQFNWLCGSNSC